MKGIVVGLANMAQQAKNSPQPDHDHDNHGLEQRYLKGKFFLSTVVKPGEDRAYPAEDREDSGLSVKVVVEMVKRKLGVTIAPNDLRTCHYTQNRSIVFRMGDLKYNSPYDETVRAINSGKNRYITVYFNFMLTRRRTDFLYHVRLAKRAGNIYRFFSDSDGSITVILREGDTRIRLTDSFDATSRTRTTIFMGIVHSVSTTVQSRSVTSVPEPIFCFSHRM
jgi:hypothetical protein